jgi:hypothetical protein
LQSCMLLIQHEKFGLAQLAMSQWAFIWSEIQEQNFATKEFFDSLRPSSVLRARLNPLIFAFFERQLPSSLNWKVFKNLYLLTFYHFSAVTTYAAGAQSSYSKKASCMYVTDSNKKRIFYGLLYKLLLSVCKSWPLE